MHKVESRKRRARRIRAKILGTAECPRLAVFRSLKYIYAQLIDDEKGKTIASFSTREIKGAKSGVESAEKAGTEIAKLASGKNIRRAVFDRHGYKYHGQVKALAEGARKGGLKF